MINIIQNHEFYDISSKYDPELINLIKQVPSRRWDPDRKVWTINKDKLGFLLGQLKGTRFENVTTIYSDEDINVNADLESTYTIPDIDISNIPFYVKEGSAPFAHQLDFMKYAIDRQQKGNMHGFILADEQGVSKSLEGINLALYNRKQYNFKHCLIIACVNTAKFTWQDEIDIHTRGVEEGYILGTRLRRDKETEYYSTGNKEKLEDLTTFRKYGKGDALPYFIIMNIEGIRYKIGKQYPIAEKITELINSGQINMVIMDEVHKNVSPQSQQGKQILNIKKRTKGKAEWIPMTGTPITSKPTDVFLPLKVVDGHEYSSYYMWCQNFCIYGGYGDHEIIGYKNIPVLKAMLQGNMIRRLKADVLDLPPKIHYTEYVENTEYQDKLYRKILSEVKSDKAQITRSLNPLASFLRLRQVNGSPELVDNDLRIDSSYIKYNAKLRRLLELLNEIHERGEKVIIFSNWVEPLRTLYKFVAANYKTCCYTGTMSAEDRNKHKRVFQNNPEYTVMIGTVGAMGTSITLTAARNVIFYDEPWTPADKEQATDRAYRIGTEGSVNIYTLITKSTVDETVHDILYTKKGVARYIVDNDVDIRNNPKLFDLLLRR